MRLLSMFTSIVVFLVIISLITPIVHACYILVVKTYEEEKFIITTEETECHAHAWAKIWHTSGLRFEDRDDDTSVRAEVHAPKNPDGITDNASALAIAVCPTGPPYCGFSVTAGSGWSADANSSLSLNKRTVNTQAVKIVPKWKMYYVPFHTTFIVIFFGETAVGVVIPRIIILDVTNNETLFNSTTVFTGADPDVVWDSTGHLYWEKFTYEREDGEVYENAYRPGDIEILLKEYEMELDPHESVDTIISLEIGGSVQDTAGSGVIGQEMGYIPTEGGISVPVDRLALLAPYISATSIILISAVASAVYIKHIRCKKENE